MHLYDEYDTFAIHIGNRTAIAPSTPDLRAGRRATRGMTGADNQVIARKKCFTVCKGFASFASQVCSTSQRKSKFAMRDS